MLDDGRETLGGFAAWVSGSPGQALLMGLAALLVLAAFVVFWARVRALKLRPIGPVPDDTPAPDPAAQRRMAGLARVLDRIGGPRRAPAKRALMRGDTQLARSTFEISAKDYPVEAARGLALVAEQEAKTEAAAAHFARMHEMERAELGPRHPQVRQGAHFYAAFLREQAPADPVLATLVADYGEQIGR